MKKSGLLITLAGVIILSMGYKTANAVGVLFSYGGATVDKITTTIFPTPTKIPFSLGQGVLAQIFLPLNKIPGAFTFSIDNDVVTIASSDTTLSSSYPVDFDGHVQFGATPDLNTIHMSTFILSGTLVSGTYNPLGTSNIFSADFCCNFGPPFNNGFEDGEVIFAGNNFVATYLPTGSTLDNVMAFDDPGSWSARLVVPEPGSLALLGTAIAVLGVIRRRRAA